MLNNCLVTAGSNIVNVFAGDREKDRQYRYIWEKRKKIQSNKLQYIISSQGT